MTTLYRHFDNEHRLLYVGISLKALERLGNHRNNAHWFERITSVEMERFPNRATALKAEQKAILKENPAFNLRRNGESFSSPKHPVLAQLGEEISNWDNGLRTLESETGVSKSTLSRMARNRNTSFEAICLVAAAFGYEIKLSRRIVRPAKS